MVDNVQGDVSGNIFVEFDYNNIVLVDPNKTVDSQGRVRERLLDHENLVMYANLEAQVLPRTKLALGIQPDENVSTTMTIAGINFLRPNRGNYMTSGYLDEITGKNSLVGRGQNQMMEQTKVDSKNQAYFTRGVVDQQSIFDNGLLGITSISIKTSTSFIPSVSMQLEDVQGRALFQLGDQSPYAAFFNLPYPQFYLTLKGYYGQAIRYQLNLEKFDARFNTATGNYSVSLEFRGFKFNILNEVLISHLIATPHMYNKRFSVALSPVAANTSTNDRNASKEASGAAKGTINTSTEGNVQPVKEFVTERGYEKIVEVYTEYKEKGLIPPDFPELTLMQFVYKMDTFEQNVLNSYPKANVEPLTNIKNYQKVLADYFDKIRGANTGSWFSIYLDPRAIVLENGQLIYFFNPNVRGNPTAKQLALDELKNLTTTSIDTLSKNPTLGLGRRDEIKLNNLGYEVFFYESLSPFDINDEKTAARFNNVVVPSISQLEQTNREVQQLLIEGTFFVFEGNNRFDNIVRNINSEASKKLSIIQQTITDELAAFIRDSATGIGFNPTVRNIVAVIMANAEGFIRLMDEVHTNAWNVRNDKVRKDVIQNTIKSAVNPEAVGVAEITPQAQNLNQGLTTAEQPVYPWPQFFVESPDDKKGRYQLTYLGDPSVVQLTKAYNFKSWPEVEFVEEYIKGLAQKDNPPTSQPPLETQLTTFLTQINAIEYPPKASAYFNKQEIRFIYEIWERQYLSAFYSNYIRANNNQRNQLLNLNTSSESQNILLSLGISNPFLAGTLKNRVPNAQAYPNYLREISSNGTGPLWIQYQAGIFNTPYIKEEVDEPLKIYKLTELGLQPEKQIPIDALRQLVIGATNDTNITDTYPFTSQSWVTNNMSLSNSAQNGQVYNTTNSLKVYANRNVISNFTDLYDYTTNRPVTNFSYLSVVQPSLTKSVPVKQTEQLDLFYSDRKPSNFIPTVGFVGNPNAKNLPKIQTTSMLNTPYFVNAIQNGVVNEKNKLDYPYIQAAYLFLNSLPLANLRERYKTNGQTTELDYIASCFNKFGAIHKLPYAWILKIGSVWHRYKTFVEKQTDILDSCWTNFNYVTNYDPITSSKTKIYSYKKGQNETVKIVLEEESNNSIKINTGFYPKVMNDFAYFYNSKDLFNTYSDTEIQTAFSDGLQIFNFGNSNINATENSKSVTVKTWSILLPETLKDAYTSPNQCLPPTQTNTNTQTPSEKFFILPSFGINVNQTKSQCLSDPTTQSVTTEPLSGNTSMFNGSVRVLWSAPNYGYFDSSVIRKPAPNEYINKILPTSDQSAFSLQSVMDYSTIEEIFGVFDRKSLNLMEKEFLDFCRPASGVRYTTSTSEIGASLSELDTSLRNFQLFLRSSMVVTTPKNPSKELNSFSEAINSQFDNFKNNIKNIMQYDVILKNGNPSKFNRRIFNSYAQTPGLRSPIPFKPYVVGSLPTNGGTTTLAQSQQRYPIEWEVLQTEVGFSTIPNLSYSNNGSYITDFFVDNDIEFSVNNITILSQLIKMYATQKLANPNLNAVQFRTNLSNFLNEETNLQNDFLNQVLLTIKKEIVVTQQPQDQTPQTQLSGTQGKSELYSLFRSLNDKWISGTDYSSKTLLEDFLFLDRASRNIGDTIIIDIFGVKNLINSNALNEQMSVYTLISGLLMQNNFTVMPLPAYVNFYNIRNVDGVDTPNVEDIQKFGNNLWGTFTNVDYRNATPKMVCFYASKPSEQLPLPKQISGYGDDGFDLRNPNNPLIENLQDKKDYNYSNKVVGFNVDIGIRNQNVFQNFSVSQDTGKATSETIAALLTMIDQTNTRNVTTQNASLYNLYKRRSYQCDVSCLGNALIQPTMYFNLRHVPMFYGPYMITEVTHNITAGDFTTNFRGVRQGYFDFPPIDNFIQKINQNLLTKIEALVFEKADKSPNVSTTQQGKFTEIISNTPKVEAASEQACRTNLNQQFQRYITATLNETKINQDDFVKEIITKFPNNLGLQTIIYCLSYVRTYSVPGQDGKEFKGTSFNFADITLDKPIGGVVKDFEKEVYTCKSIRRSDDSYISLPTARFANIGKFLDFMGGLLSPRVNQILSGGMIEYYCTAFPSTGISLEYYKNNQAEVEARFLPIFEQALLSANARGLTTDFRLTPTQTAGTTNNLNTTTNALPQCPQTSVTDFTPKSGPTGTIISLSGTNLEYVREINVANVLVDPRSIVFVDSRKIKFSIPALTLTPPINVTIQIRALGNSQPINVTPTFTFTSQ